MIPSERILVALDTPDVDVVRKLADKLFGHVGGFKLGLEFFSANGPDAVRSIVDTGFNVFLDLKFHDIPNTVAGAVRAATATGASILNLHTSGGLAMMRAAADAASEGSALYGVARPILVGVTVLTSLDANDLEAVGQKAPPRDQVIRLARLAKKAGLDGVVCSAQEAGNVRDVCGEPFVRIVPGVRPSWSATNDQKRVTTPKEALAAGATYIVVGRPITGAQNPLDAAARIVEELEAA
ncbi:MAG: orotidine-5'-phosphate decarboxylase [Pseudomonadota bacterium]|nr:orotidine-5'-phosphate decarboxylase [Pseudomonadota bacterium]